MRGSTARGAGLPRAVGEVEHAQVKARLLELEALAQLEVVAHLRVVEIDALGEHARGELGRARLLRGPGAVEAHQVAVEIERDARDFRKRLLECGVAARVVARVEIGEAVHEARVRSRIVEEVRGAEVEAAASREHLVAPRGVGRRIWIGARLGVRLGVGHAHLHGPSGAHRVAILEERVSERDAADEILEDVGELLLGSRRVDALLVAAPVGGRQLERRLQDELRHAGALALALDLLPCDRGKVRDLGIGVEAALLLGHRDDRADVLSARRDPERRHSRVDVGRPALAVVEPARQEARDQGARLGGGHRKRFPARRLVRGAAGEEREDSGGAAAARRPHRPPGRPIQIAAASAAMRTTIDA